MWAKNILRRTSDCRIINTWQTTKILLKGQETKGRNQISKPYPYNKFRSQTKFNAMKNLDSTSFYYIAMILPPCFINHHISLAWKSTTDHYIPYTFHIILETTCLLFDSTLSITLISVPKPYGEINKELKYNITWFLKIFHPQKKYGYKTRITKYNLVWL